jgi:hypothetical protein
MASIMALCSQGLFLKNGSINKIGKIDDVIAYYLDGVGTKNNVALSQRKDSGDQSILLDFVKVTNDKGQVAVSCSDKLKIEIGYVRKKPVQPKFMIRIYDDFQRPIFFLDSEVAGDVLAELLLQGSVVCHTDPINLTPGMCHVNLAIMNLGSISDRVINATSFNVEADDFFWTGKIDNRQTSLCLLRNTRKNCK